MSTQKVTRGNAPGAVEGGSETFLRPDLRAAPDAPVNLRDERRRRGRSLRAAADEIGVSVRVLRRAEAGSRPHPGNARALAEFYGLDVVVQWPDDARVAA